MIINDLIAFYKLNYLGLSNEVEEEHNSYDGTGSDVLVGSNGVINNCFDFNRSNPSYVRIPNDIRNDLDNSNAITVSFWFKNDIFPSYNTRHIMINNHIEGSYTGFNIRLRYDALGKSLQVAARSDYTDSYSLTSIPYDDTNNWHHCVAIFNFSSGYDRIYLDGNLEITQSKSRLYTYYNLGNPTVSDAFGCNLNDASGSAYDGELDEIGIWKRAITSDEVSDLYNDGLGISYPFILNKININDEWRTIREMQININDTWRTITSMDINKNDNWKDSF